MPKLAKAYRGVNHQTLGSDLLAILKALPIPDQLLGKDSAARLREIDPKQWYPISMLLEPLEALASRMGDRSLVPIGYSIIRVSHEANIRQNVKSARALLEGFDAIYKSVNRGQDVGGWKVLTFEPGRAVLENTTPHHCFLEVGIVQEALRVVGVPAVVKQSQCVREGAESCHFVVTSSLKDQVWSG